MLYASSGYRAVSCRVALNGRARKTIGNPCFQKVRVNQGEASTLKVGTQVGSPTFGRIFGNNLKIAAPTGVGFKNRVLMFIDRPRLGPRNREDDVGEREWLNLLTGWE